MGDLIRHMLTPNSYFRPGVEDILNIVNNWDHIQRIPLNKVARLIKLDEEYV